MHFLSELHLPCAKFTVVVQEEKAGHRFPIMRYRYPLMQQPWFVFVDVEINLIETNVAVFERYR